MNHSTYTQQAPSSFQLNLTTVADACFPDEQALAQREFDSYIEAQAQTVAPAKDPLNARDRRIIATIVDSTPEQIRTIWIESGITVWVQFFDGGRLAFDRNWFATRVQQVKATLPETISERNERLEVELKQACKKFGLTHGQVDWLSFSATLYRNNQHLGIVGYNLDNNWYSRRNQLGASHKVNNIDAAIALLGVRQPLFGVIAEKGECIPQIAHSLQTPNQKFKP